MSVRCTQCFDATSVTERKAFWPIHSPAPTSPYLSPPKPNTPNCRSALRPERTFYRRHLGQRWLQLCDICVVNSGQHSFLEFLYTQKIICSYQPLESIYSTGETKTT